MELGTLLFLLLYGILAAVWPYHVEWVNKKYDAIGTKRFWSEVEPAEWKVFLVRLFGIGSVLSVIVIFVLNY